MYKNCGIFFTSYTDRCYAAHGQANDCMVLLKLKRFIGPGKLRRDRSNSESCFTPNSFNLNYQNLNRIPGAMFHKAFHH